MSVNWSDKLAPRMAGITASEIRELLKLIDQPDIISFAGGIPDPDLFPRDAIARAHEQIFRSNSQCTSALQYSISEGYLPLREWLAARTGASADSILITNGSQQGLDFIGKLLIAPGDPVAVTAPTYLGALQAFSPYQPRYLAVPMDDQGIRIDVLETVLAEKPKFLYLVPEFQNPTGATLTLERRRQVLDLCRKAGVPVVEDAAYAELRYEGEKLPSLQSLDGPGDDSIVLYAGTFSKTIVPALRVGWLSGPKAIIQKLVLVKQAADLHVGTLNQMVLHKVVEECFDEQTARIRTAYRERRDAMLAALDEFMPKTCRWTRPEGGMFVWIELPKELDGKALLEAAIRDARVAFVPGAAFFPDRSGTNTIRLSYSVSKPDRIREGVRRLADLVTRMSGAASV